MDVNTQRQQQVLQKLLPHANRVDALLADEVNTSRVYQQRSMGRKDMWYKDNAQRTSVITRLLMKQRAERGEVACLLLPPSVAHPGA